MADQAVISSLTSSMNSYYRAAAQYDSAATTAQNNINSLTIDRDKKVKNKQKVDAVNGRLGELDQKDETIENDLSFLADGACTQLDDDGARSGLKQINDNNAGHISAAKSAASALSQKLQDEIDALNQSIATETTARDNAQRNAASARSSAASCSAAIAREQAS